MPAVRILTFLVSMVQFATFYVVCQLTHLANSATCKYHGPSLTPHVDFLHLRLCNADEASNYNFCSNNLNR